MVFCAVTASVFFFSAVLSKMIPSLAFQASYWFVFDFFCAASFVAYIQSICNGPISYRSIADFE